MCVYGGGSLLKGEQGEQGVIKGVYREEGMQLALFSESSDFVLSYF